MMDANAALSSNPVPSVGDTRSVNGPPPLLSLAGVTRDFGKGHGLFDIGLSIARGRVMALIGANGSGKTTLLRCAMMIELPEKGRIEMDGHCVIADGVVGSAGKDRPDPRALRGRFVGAVFQESEPWPHLSVLENILLPLRKGLLLAPGQAAERAESVLMEFGLADRRSCSPAQLSGGMRQRLVLARAMSLRPRLLLLDEATGALDPEWTEKVRACLRQYVESGAGVLVISHQMGLVRGVADQVVFLHQGRIEAEGTPSVMLDNPREPALQEFLKNA